MMQTTLQPRAYKAFSPYIPGCMVTLVPAQKASSPEIYGYDASNPELRTPEQQGNINTDLLRQEIAKVDFGAGKILDETNAFLEGIESVRTSSELATVGAMATSMQKLKLGLFADTHKLSITTPGSFVTELVPEGFTIKQIPEVTDTLVR